jgi:HSP20 family molecular chaperone IbpA
MPATKTAFSSLPALASTTPTFRLGAAAEELEQSIYARISERAYSLYEQSGREPGNEDANWMRAESEILRAGAEVRESGSWLALTAFLPDVSGQEMQIAVRPRRLLVRATAAGKKQDFSDRNGPAAGEIFLAANLAVDVDPSSAAASFRDQTLRLMVRKRRSDKIQ